MKRSLLSALIIGLIVGGIVMGLHVSGFLLRPELAITDILSRDGSANRLISDKAQYVIVFLLAAAVAWMTLATSRRARMGAIVGLLLLEIIGTAWMPSLKSRKSFSRTPPRHFARLALTSSLPVAKASWRFLVSQRATRSMRRKRPAKRWR